AIRAIHGPHLIDDFFVQIARQPLILDIVKHHLGEDVYVHQYKINMKQGMDGKAWPWHQDFVFWQQNDHIVEPKLVNVAIVLNDTNMLNGPLCFIPNSHHKGDLCTPTKTASTIKTTSDWRNDVSAELSFQLDKKVVAELLSNNEPHFGTGKPGDVHLFDTHLAHCSGNNLSPDNRRLLIITYNALSNAPKAASDRPEFLCATDTSPL
ncbi:MAG: phytanoyl-CoA dioxygenase family protein, partial [Psychrosphaera sp.]|nr:phytanoyl-CoA dioxygenase family protein [Psychrosphaera sp.]